MREKDMAEHVKWTIMVMLLLIIILFYVGVKESGRANRGEAYRKQLIVLYGVVDEVISDDYVIKSINIVKDLRGGVIEDVIELVSYTKKADGREYGASYTIFSDGEVELIHDKKLSARKLNWKDFPKFSKIGKK